MKPTTSSGRRRTAVSVTAALALVTSGTVLAPAAVADDGVIEIPVLAINDFHGRIMKDLGGGLPGAALLAGAIDAQRAENANVIFASAGDNIGASIFESFSLLDEPTIDVLKEMGLDVSAVGNHEFDRGYDDLVNRVLPRYSDTEPGRFGLGANVYEKGTDTPALEEFAVVEREGVRVGFIGTVTTDTPNMVTPTGVADLDFGDELEAVERVAETLTNGDEGDGEADIVVLLTHSGFATSSCEALLSDSSGYLDFLESVPAEVDAIFTGHTHQSYACDVPVAGGGTRPVVQGLEYGKALSSVTFTVDANSKEILSTSRASTPLLQGNPAAPVIDVEVPEVAAIVAAAKAAADEVGEEVVGKITADVLRGGTKGSDRGVESTLGNLVADIYLWATTNEDFAGEPAQIAFMNPGGLREDLVYDADSEGDVTYRQVAAVQPFANTLVAMDLTGAQIKQILTDQWKATGDRPKLHLGISEGFDYTYTEFTPRSGQIHEIRLDGDVIADDDVVRVVTNSFLAAGGDGFPDFADGTNRADTGQVDLEASIRFFEANPVVDPAPLGRAVPTKDLQILAINDFHGRISQDIGGGLVGAATLSGVVQRLSDEREDTVFASAGDNIGASTFESFSLEDEPTIDVLKEMGLDVSAVGNHEFDRGFNDLVTRVLPRYSDTDGGKYGLGANVYIKGTKIPVLQEYAIEKLGDLDVAFIGTVTTDTPNMVTPTGVAGLDFGDEVEAVERVADKLTDGNASNGEADLVVLLSHSGFATGSCSELLADSSGYLEFLQNVPASVDAIFTGHTHQAYACDVPVAGSSDTRPVVQGLEYGKNLSRVLWMFDDEDELLGVHADSLPLIQPSGSSWQLLYTETDPDVAAIVADAVIQSGTIGNQPVGKISGDVLRGGTNGSDRGVESTLGNLVADVYLWATSNEDFAGEPAQVAFMNPGGLRADLLYGADGTVTYKQVASVQPFANTLVAMDLTGAQIKQILTDQWKATGDRPKLHLGISEGFEYYYTETSARSGVIHQIRFDGEVVGDDDVLRIVTNSFLAAGGDGFPDFAEGVNRADTGQVDLEATVRYFQAFTLVDPAPLGRAIAGEPPVTPEPPVEKVKTSVELVVVPSSVTAGTKVTAVALVTGSPTGTVEFRAKGKKLGSAKVKNGRATAKLALKVGTWNITAHFKENATHLGSVSKAEKVKVVKAASKITSAKASKKKVSKKGTVTITVKVSPKALAKKGTVTVRLGSKKIGSAKVSSKGVAKVKIKASKLGKKKGTKKLNVRFEKTSQLKASKKVTVKVTLK